MNKFFVTCILSVSLCSSAFATDFSGKYTCHLDDRIDGSFDETLIVKNNPKASLPKQGYMSYDLEFTEVGTANKYTGFAAASGDNMAIYFESTGKNTDDRGIGIASVSEKNIKISFRKFYYEQAYKGKANYGFEDCVKISK